MTDTFERLVRALVRARVRFVVIGLAGANYYARSSGTLFLTQDRDLLLPLDPDQVLAAWDSCQATGLELLCGREPLDRPRDRFLAERLIANRALVRATDGAGLDVDLTFVMAGFDFETVWAQHRVFRIGAVKVPVARLGHIIESKRLAGRDKDRLFLVTHAEAIRDLAEADQKHRPERSRLDPSGKARGRRRPGRPR